MKSALQFFNPVKKPTEKASIETSMIIRVPNLKPIRDGINTINRTVATINAAATKKVYAVSFLNVLRNPNVSPHFFDSLLPAINKPITSNKAESEIISRFAMTSKNLNKRSDKKTVAIMVKIISNQYFLKKPISFSILKSNFKIRLNPEYAFPAALLRN